MFWKLPHIAVPSDPLFTIFGFPVFNTLLLSVVSALIIILLFAIALRKISIVPRRFQNLTEWFFVGVLNICEEVAGRRNGRRFFPWVMTIFLFVLIGNWWELIPGVETIGTVSHDTAINAACANASGLFLTGSQSNCIMPWLRPPSTDLNFALALALISFVATQVYGFVMLGAGKQLGRYFTLREGPMGLIVGLLELLLEPLRIISLSFRLFGNLFAGDVLLLVAAFLLPVVGAVPFYFLELFVGFVQAFVFAFLTLIFMTLGTTVHGHEDHQEEEVAAVAHEQHVIAERALSHGEVAAR